MRLLLLNQFFHPDLSATAQLAAELAEDLAAAGVEVTALCSRGTYLGGDRLPAEETWRGVRIRRLPATSLGKRTAAHRLLDYATFHAAAAAALATLPRQDLILAMTTPPLIAAVALPARWRHGARLVCWVQDLYPDVAVALGTLAPGSISTRALARLSRVLMRRADGVVVLGEAMRERCLAQGAAPERIAVVPGWADPEAVRPVPHGENPLRRTLAGEARTLVMYSGNMGRAHDVATLLAAADRLRGDPAVRFHFQGDGTARELVARAARRAPNVRLGPYWPKDQLSEALSAADLHLVSLDPRLAGLVEPSKLYGIMAAGRPAIFAGPDRSEVARIIRDEGCGVVVPPGDPAALAEAIRSLAADEERRIALGDAGRRAILGRYGRQEAVRRFRDLLAGALNR